MRGGIVCFLVSFRKEGDSSLNSNLDEKVNQFTKKRSHLILKCLDTYCPSVLEKIGRIPTPHFFPGGC